MRVYENKRHLLIYDMRPVEDWNELTYHNLEVIYNHCNLTQFKKF